MTRRPALETTSDEAIIVSGLGERFGSRGPERA
jgi:hypothetical protein